MSELKRAFITTADTTFKKVEDKNGVTRHFKDGTPVTKKSFDGGSGNVKYEGQNAQIAIPSNKGPGYERIEVNPIEASQLGKQLNLVKDNVMGEPREQVLLGADTDNVGMYDVNELFELNGDIAEKFGPDSVMKYTS